MFLLSKRKMTESDQSFFQSDGSVRLFPKRLPPTPLTNGRGMLRNREQPDGQRPGLTVAIVFSGHLDCPLEARAAPLPQLFAVRESNPK